jgi:hypothetical protein
MIEQFVCMALYCTVASSGEEPAYLLLYKILNHKPFSQFRSS